MSRNQKIVGIVIAICLVITISILGSKVMSMNTEVEKLKASISTLQERVKTLEDIETDNGSLWDYQIDFNESVLNVLSTI